MTNVGAASGIEDGAGGVTLFGVTFTSKILGILIGVGGIALAAYVASNYVMPLWESVQTGQTKIADTKTKVTTLEGQVASKGNIAQRIEAANQQNKLLKGIKKISQKTKAYLKRGVDTTGIKKELENIKTSKNTSYPNHGEIKGHQQKS